ncbi:hypothetical protein Tco_0953038 [Tanacetum coccineum]|uniref:Uncharacterized protein n=1 Tax=Tanacetum coccineum TaxID=301880 RepID=A0ABQ5E1J9_9ASTR
MPTEIELTLEQTQQGVSYEVSVFTMKMEILLEPTSNKLMVEHAEYDESNTYVLERFNTTAGNPVKKILLKLNLSDHRLFKDGDGDFRYSDTTHLSRSVEVLKLNNFKKDATLKLFKNVTQHYLPKKTESAFAKPDHMIASSSSRNSSKNMPRFSSNDMVHNHYLDEARKKTQERDRNSKTSMMPSARFQCTTDDSKPKPRSNNQTSRSLPVSKSSHVTITAVPKADHSKSSSSLSLCFDF